MELKDRKTSLAALALGLALSLLLLPVVVDESSQGRLPPERGESAPTSDRPTPRDDRAGLEPRSGAPAGGEETATGRTAAAATSLPRLSDGTIDFASLGLTGDEPGAELLRTEETRELPIELAFAPGERWTVHTYFRQAQAPSGQTWSGPVRWRYQVTGEVVHAGRPCLVVAVDMLKASGLKEGRFPRSTFLVDREARRLVAANVPDHRSGARKAADLGSPDRAAGASGADLGLVPFDLPPDGVLARRTRGTPLPHLEPEIASDSDRLPRPDDLVGADGDLLEISFASPRDGAPVRQRWSTGDMRWPIESITSTTRSYRVD